MATGMMVDEELTVLTGRRLTQHHEESGGVAPLWSMTWWDEVQKSGLW